jgi:hypothetical protein
MDMPMTTTTTTTARRQENCDFIDLSLLKKEGVLPESPKILGELCTKSIICFQVHFSKSSIEAKSNNGGDLCENKVSQIWG